jgi:rSAM/selenodomain-associated transferase 2
MSLAIIMPVLNEADAIAGALAALGPARAAGADIIVVDGGSLDRTTEIAARHDARVIGARRGRAAQMNAGAAATRAETLLFLHADTRLPDGAIEMIRDGLGAGDRAWGRFDVNIAGGGMLLRLVATMMNLRSRLTGIATGDQAMFMTRTAFAAAGGFPEIALMEDVEMSRRLRRMSRPLRLRARVTTSGRRWRKNGVVRTILLMWRLRLAYWLGADPDALARRYDHAPGKN